MVEFMLEYEARKWRLCGLVVTVSAVDPEGRRHERAFSLPADCEVELGWLKSYAAATSLSLINAIEHGAEPGELRLGRPPPPIPGG